MDLSGTDGIQHQFDPLTVSPVDHGDEEFPCYTGTIFVCYSDDVRLPRSRERHLEYCVRLLLERDFTGYPQDVVINVTDNPEKPPSLFPDLDAVHYSYCMSVEFLLFNSNGLAWLNCLYYVFKRQDVAGALCARANRVGEVIAQNDEEAKEEPAEELKESLSEGRVEEPALGLTGLSAGIIRRDLPVLNED